MRGALRNEALHYWTNVQRFRVASRMAGDTSEEADELALVAQHTEHAGIRRDIVRLMAPAVHADAK